MLAQYHYYPFGMQMQGPWIGAGSTTDERYQYNGIEFVDDHDLNLNMSSFRMLDPSTGRWLQNDPLGEHDHAGSGYGSMYNDPVTFTDPNGDMPGFGFGHSSMGPIGFGGGSVPGANSGPFGNSGGFTLNLFNFGPPANTVLASASPGTNASPWPDLQLDFIFNLPMVIVTATRPTSNSPVISDEFLWYFRR